jgi:hypothetical protein
MAVWSTSLTQPIILYEQNTNIDIVVTVEADTTSSDTGSSGSTGSAGSTGTEVLTLTSLTVTPNNGFFTISTVNATSMKIHAASLDGIIPINFIKYRENDNLLTAYNWESTPDNCQIYNYSKSPGPITVTVNVSALSTPSNTVSDYSFTITVQGDFSTGITKLLSKVNKSSEFRK